MDLTPKRGVDQVSNSVLTREVQGQGCEFRGLVLQGAYAPDLQRCGHCANLLVGEALQKPVLIDECDSAAGIKASHRVGVRALWEVLRGKGDSCCGVGQAPETEARSMGRMHGLRNNDRDGWGGLGGCRWQRLSHAAGFYVRVHIWLRGKRRAAFGANGFNPNKVDKDLVEPLVWIVQFFFIRLKRSMKAFRLLLCSVAFNLIYPFFILPLIAAVRLVWLVPLPQCV